MTDPRRVDSLLKRELDRLLLENQELHATLRRFDELPYLVGRLATVLRRRVGGRLARARGRQLRAGPHDTSAGFAGSFRPYEVRPARPPAAARPRVLHAIGNFHVGGSSRLVVDLAERLGDSYEHVTVARDHPGRPHYVGLELHEAPGFASRREASSLLRRLRPDLLHVHFLGHHRNRYSRADWDWYDCLFRAAGEYGCPVVENVNIPVPPYVSDDVDCYVFVSDYVRAVFGLAGRRNVTIYPGSDFELFSRRTDAAPPDACAGMVYRLEKDKLDESAIDVFVEVLRRRPEARAVIVGGGRLLEGYRAAVESAGVADSTTFTGYVAYEDLPRLYEQMSVFVAPVHRESFGHVVPLAMGMGIPVAAYDVGALPEILGEEAVLAPAGDPAALAAAVDGLLGDRERHRRIGEAGRERAHRLFSVERMAADYRALYDELTAPG